MTQHWIERVALTCREAATDYVDILIDQSGFDFSVIPALKSLSIEWQSLFTGLPEASLVDVAPLMARINLNDAQHMLFLHDFSQHAAAQAPLLILCSHWPFATLAGWLTQCIDAQQEGRAGILRFYDTRIFPLLFSHTLSEEQQQTLLRPALFWSWQDRDGEPQILNGDGVPPEQKEPSLKINLSDSQCESLMSICDVVALLEHQAPPAGIFSSQQTLFLTCYEGMLEATKKGLLMDDQREAWVMMKWSAADESIL
ncbi:DUF4123 domain-containing protein [Serratia proteamaculans]